MSGVHTAAEILSSPLFPSSVTISNHNALIIFQQKPDAICVQQVTCVKSCLQTASEDTFRNQVTVFCNT